MRYSYQILIKLEFARQIFEKYSNVKLNENQFRVRRVILYGRTDTRNEANSRLSQFCERA